MGQVMRATGVGEVIESNTAGLEVGDRVLGSLGWQDVADVRGKTLSASRLMYRRRALADGRNGIDGYLIVSRWPAKSWRYCSRVWSGGCHGFNCWSAG